MVSKITICSEVDIDQIAGLLVPIGSIQAFGTETVPEGYLICDGSAVSRTEYAELFSALGSVWGDGDGSTTFNVPELRGEFLRGLDIDRGADTGRLLGSSQSWAIENITGSVACVDHFFKESNAGGGSTDGAFNVAGSTGGAPTGSSGSSYAGATFDASRVVNTSTETRPRNVAVVFAIKAFYPTTNSSQ